MVLELDSWTMKSPHDIDAQRAVAAEIKYRRGLLKVSQEELAHLAGVHRTFIGKLEVAQTQPSICVLFRLAQALEVEFSELATAIERRYRIEVEGRHSDSQPTMKGT